MAEISPVRRWHGGTAFRSTLEADWAATLDYLEIRWAYEPRALTLPSRTVYVPDFWLPEIRTWLEVKGEEVPGLGKTHELARAPVCGCDGECDCAERGGVMVIVGRSPRFVAGERYGAMRWDDPLSFGSFLARCGRCDGRFWMRAAESFRCRRCGVLDKGSLGHLYSGTAGDMEFYRADRHEWTEVR